MRSISLPSGDRIPVLGLGTWHLAEIRARRNAEIAALCRGLDIGMNLIDTAEMYANGHAEVLVRLNADRLDLYLLHWRGSVPLAETVEGFLSLQADGLIRNWGVSNFDVSDLEDALTPATWAHAQRTTLSTCRVEVAEPGDLSTCRAWPPDPSRSPVRGRPGPRGACGMRDSAPPKKIFSAERQWSLPNY
jgi:aryl-alcohol dehydrogenase-like predicted oxidoreductase